MNASMSPLSTTPRLRAQDRRALMLGAIALVVLVGYSRIVRPALESMRMEQRTLAEQEALLARERSLVAAAPALPRARQDVTQALAAEAPRLFAGDSVAATAELSAYVSQIASASGVHLTTVDGRTPVTTRGLTRLSVDVRGEASWNQVLNFVHVLESSGQLVDVTSVRIERGPRGGPLGGAMVSVAATLAGYSRAVR
jgi:type II secretory pathway component PulM